MVPPFHCQQVVDSTRHDGPGFVLTIKRHIFRPAYGAIRYRLPPARRGHNFAKYQYCRESDMRRLWYRDSYGRWHEDRHAGGRAGMPAKWAIYALMVLAGIVVLASMVH
jgi:hypothetical protein